MVDRFISKPPKPPLVSWANNASDLTKKRALGQLNDYGNNNREMEILAVNYDKLNLCNDIPHEHVELLKKYKKWKIKKSNFYRISNKGNPKNSLSYHNPKETNKQYKEK